MTMSGDSDVEMRDVHQQTSDDVEMKDAQQQTTDDIEMIDTTPKSFSNEASCEKVQFPKECFEETGGADSSKKNLEEHESARAKERDDSPKESLEKPQSTTVKGEINSAKERVEEPQSTPVDYGDKFEEASRKESLLSLEISGEKPTKENTEKQQPASIGCGNTSAKEHMEEPESSPIRDDDKKDREHLGEQASSLVNGDDKITNETIDEPQSASSKEREISAKKCVKEPPSSPVESKDNSHGSMKLIMEDKKSRMESVERAQSPAVKGNEDFNSENCEEKQLAAMKLEDEALLDSLAYSEPEAMSFDDMVEEMLDNDMYFEGDQKERFEMVLVARERERNCNKNLSQENTKAEWRKAVDRNHERHGKCCHMDALSQESAGRIKTEGLTPYRDKDESYQQVTDKEGKVDNAEKKLMDGREKVENQPYVDTRRQQIFPHKEESTYTYKNQDVDSRGNCNIHSYSILDDPRQQTVDENTKKANPGLTSHAVTDKPRQEVIDKGGSVDSLGRMPMEEREKKINESHNNTQIRQVFQREETETTNPHKNQEMDHPSPIESSSKYTDSGNGRNGNYQSTGYYQPDKYKGCNYSTYGGNSFNRTSHDAQSRDSNFRSDYGGTRTRQTSQDRETESTNLLKKQERDRPSPVESSSKYTDSGNGRNGNYHGTRYYQPDKYKGCNNSTYGGHSFNSTSPDSRSSDTNFRSDYGGTRTQQNFQHRETESTNLPRKQERDHHSPFKSPSRNTDYGNGRFDHYQGTRNYQGNKYNGCKDSDSGGNSFNRMSHGYQSRDTNVRSDNGGREQNWRSAHYNNSSYDKQPKSEENSSYSDTLYPSELINSLSEYRDFRASLLQIMEEKGLEPATVRKTVNAHSQLFQVDGEMVEFRPKLGFCKAHIGKNGCQNKDSCNELHICNVYLRSYCHEENCVLGHKWFTHHNNPVLKSFYMEGLTVTDLRKIAKMLIITSRPSGLLGICKSYNERKCSNQNCDDLHICYSFVAGRSKCSISDCRLNHNILSPECSELLKHHGFSINETPRDVVMTLLSANSSIVQTPLSNSPNKYSSDKRSGDSSRSNQTSQVMTRKGNTSDNNSSNRGKSSKALWSHNFHGDSNLAEICYYSVEGNCRNDDSGCTRLHSSLHYHWQVSEQGTSWFNLSIHQVTYLEHAFCDPAQDGVTLPQIDPSKLHPNLKGLLNILGPEKWRANFEAMILANRDHSKILYIRRLCTERILGKTLKQNTYVWYFLDKNNKWVRYGNVDSAGEKKLVSSVTSAEIEKHFSKTPNVMLIFKNASFTYSLDFNQMTQRNQQTKVIRRVRRRPDPHFNVGKK